MPSFSKLLMFSIFILIITPACSSVSAYETPNTLVRRDDSAVSRTNIDRRSPAECGWGQQCNGSFRPDLQKLFPLGYIDTIAPSHRKIKGLFVREFGDSRQQPIVFLHGGPGLNGYKFSAAAAKDLAQRGFYVIVFDQRGAGLSDDFETEIEISFENAVADVQTIIENYADVFKSKPILVGHSWGGTLGIKYVESHPNSVKGLILVSSPLDQLAMVQEVLDRCAVEFAAKGNSKKVADIEALRGEIFAAGNYVMTYELAVRFFDQAADAGLYLPKIPTPESTKLRRILSSAPGAPLIGYETAPPLRGLLAHGWMRGSLVPNLKTIKNAYGIFGSDDGLFTPALLDDIKSALPPGHFCLLQNASHSLFIDQKERFIEFVVATATSLK